MAEYGLTLIIVETLIFMMLIQNDYQTFSNGVDIWLPLKFS